MSNTRATKQRKAILNYLKSVRTHPSAEIVYEAVKEDLPHLTLATVYRNLHLLADQGTILRFKVANEYHFDGFPEQHQHLICNSCLKIVDVFDKSITKTITDFKHSDFKVETADVLLRGICKDCQAKNMSAKIN